MSATALVLILSMLIRNVNIFSVIFPTLAGEQVSSVGICYIEFVFFLEFK